MDTKPDVVLHSTGSFFDRVYPQIMRAIRAGADVVSTCETLAWLGTGTQTSRSSLIIMREAMT